MKSRLLMTISAASLVAAFAMTNQTVAQVSSASAERESEHLRFTVTDLGTLKGGTFSEPFHMNGNGVVSGVAVLPDNSQHAVLWFRKAVADLGTLGGMNSTAFGDNARDQATGEAETPDPDPNDEDFCGFGSHAICKPFVWERGVMAALPTLGGNNGGGNQITDAGMVLDLRKTPPRTSVARPHSCMSSNPSSGNTARSRNCRRSAAISKAWLLRGMIRGRLWARQETAQLSIQTASSTSRRFTRCDGRTAR